MSCERCGGFKIFDHFYGALQCNGYRCINCGAITGVRIVMPATHPRSVESGRRIRPKASPVESAFAHAGVAHANEIER